MKGYVSIISAVLSKKIIPFGRAVNEIGDMLFDKADVMKVVKNSG